MGDITVSIIVFLTFFISAGYIVKEAIKRKQQKSNKDILEAHWDIRGAIVNWTIAIIMTIGFIVAHYLKVFSNSSTIAYLYLCLIGMAFEVLAFILAFNKITINKKTGRIKVCSITHFAQFSVNEVTSIKHTAETWQVFSNNKKMFTIRNRYHNYPNEFYNYLSEESACNIIEARKTIDRDVE